MYASRMVTYEKTTPSTGFFDALGRMYRQIKSRIKYYMGKETKVQKTVEVGEELYVWKRNFVDFSGSDAVSYIKQNNEKSIVVDSSVYFDKSYSILEINNKENYARLRLSDGNEYYNVYDEFDDMKQIYSVSADGDTLQYPLYSYETQVNTNEIREGTVALMKKGVGGFTCEIDNGKEKKNLNNKNTLLKNNQEICSEINTTILSAVCERPNKPTDDFYEKTGLLFYPGVGGDATFGALVLPEYPEPPKTFYRCECIDEETYVFDFRVEYDAFVLIYDYNWGYNIDKEIWERKCWRTEDKQKTYEHEIQHYNNLLIQYPKILNEHFVTKDNYKERGAMRTMSTCLSVAKINCELTRKTYMLFQSVEVRHEGGKGKYKDYPISPKPTSENNRKGREVKCTE